MLVPKEKPGLIERAEKEVKEIEQQYVSGLVTAGERYNKVVDIWGKTGDEVGKVMMGQLSKQKVHRPPRQGSRPGVVQLHLHDGRLGCARFGRADPPAGRHARPDGQAGRLDHRDADHGQLPRRPERSAVLHLHPRRAQGPGGHGAEDRELGLPDAPPGRRDAGPGGHRGRLRHAERHRHARAGRRRRGHRVAARPHPRPRHGDRGAAPRDAGSAAAGRRDARRRRARHARSRRRRRGQGAHAADLRHALRPVRQVLRPRPGPRRPGQHRRGGRRDRRAVDRRAGHAADDAHLPHRWCGVACGGGLQRRRQVRRHRRLQRHDALRDQRQGRAGGDLAFRRDRHRRPARPRARAPQGAVRRAAERQARPVAEGRHGAGQLGPADPPDHHRVRRQGEVRERRGRRHRGQASSTR